MVLTGTLINGAAIIVAGCIGLMIQNIPEKMKTTVLQAIALAIILLGIQMGLQTEQFLLVIGSLAVGGVIGEWIGIDSYLNKFGMWIETKLKPAKSGESGKVAQAFVTTTLIYVVGAMAVLGSIDSGLRGDHSLLYTKAMLDGLSAIIFASTLGFGVLLSAIPVVLYQGGIALMATYIAAFVPDVLLEQFILEMSAVGGIMVVAIGLNILGVTSVRVANLLPALPILALLIWILSMF
ncbi:DUF554 domain-containing protein [Alkalicoccobacillus murimartini]|uniref:Membrane protein YqgA involved in biofilm formation n=1 Tax=Alkalicoccobacillus murimartini TaxID=171685 RepID=A0ABT9YQ16_9BACI|nr:DUF554 domain-containing protein [Alkalicoccobacillus murimartini]MDQ0209129.1 putative membrane protein YqgA involved in biofilm formation [Alkalicoccobacillus murimartini]